MLNATTNNIWDIGAKEHADQASTINFYYEKKTIVDILFNEGAKTILDLGCGGKREISSGLLNEGLQTGDIASADGSQEMIANANQNFTNQAEVVFYPDQAESIDNYLQRTFDAVTVNSSHLPYGDGQKIKAVNNILNEEGKFLFSISQRYLKQSETDAHPKHQVINEELNHRGLPLKEPKDVVNRFNDREIFQLLESNSFGPYKYETMDIAIKADR